MHCLPYLPSASAGPRAIQSSIAFRIACGARLLHFILYSGIPPRASATACSDIFDASSTDLPSTISVAMDEQAIATAHPMHLNFTSCITPCSMRNVTNTASLSRGLFTIALPEASAMLPTLRGLAKCSRTSSLYKRKTSAGLRSRLREKYHRSRCPLDIYSKAAELTGHGKAFAVATVVRVEGSSSARRGSKAIIDAQGQLLYGWVGGGCAESAVRNEALRSIELQQPLLITLDMTDELLGVGMPCGGKMEVYIEPVLPSRDLLIAGHGRIAEALATFAHLLGFRIIVNDPGADPSSFPQAEQVIAEDFDLNQTPITHNTYVVIATQHKNDHLWLQKALEGEAAYVALIASHHRARLVLDYLAAEGVPAEKISKIFAPAGLDLGAATPEEIALSIMSQIVAQRRGGSTAALHLQPENLDANEQETEANDKIIRKCDAHPAD
jgi:xanthine dehydrogenase accessory factor